MTMNYVLIDKQRPSIGTKVSAISSESVDMAKGVCKGQDCSFCSILKSQLMNFEIS